MQQRVGWELFQCQQSALTAQKALPSCTLERAECRVCTSSSELHSVALQRAMYRKCVGVCNKKIYSLQQKFCTWRHEERLWKCDSNFGDFHVLHFNRRITCFSGAWETSTTFGLMKPFEIPLVKVKKYAWWSCLKHDSSTALLLKSSNYGEFALWNRRKDTYHYTGLSYSYCQMWHARKNETKHEFKWKKMLSGIRFVRKTVKDISLMIAGILFRPLPAVRGTGCYDKKHYRVTSAVQTLYHHGTSNGNTDMPS